MMAAASGSAGNRPARGRRRPRGGDRRRAMTVRAGNLRVRVALAALVAVGAGGTGGCMMTRYLAQAAHGQVELLDEGAAARRGRRRSRDAAAHGAPARRDPVDQAVRPELRPQDQAQLQRVHRARSARRGVVRRWRGPARVQAAQVVLPDRRVLRRPRLVRRGRRRRAQARARAPGATTRSCARRPPTRPAAGSPIRCCRRCSAAATTRSPSSRT